MLLKQVQMGDKFEKLIEEMPSKSSIDVFQINQQQFRLPKNNLLFTTYI